VGTKAYSSTFGENFNSPKKPSLKLIGIAIPKPSVLSTSPVVPYWSSSSASGFPSASNFAKLMDQAYTNPVLAGIIFDGLHHWFHKTLNHSHPRIHLMTVRLRAKRRLDETSSSSADGLYSGSFFRIPTLDQYTLDTSEQWHPMVGFYHQNHLETLS
jgi:hypothetical protein